MTLKHREVRNGMERWANNEALCFPCKAGGAHFYLSRCIPDQFAEEEPLGTLFQTCGIPRLEREGQLWVKPSHKKRAKQ